ncbi:MAG: aminopeptidase P family N-terminal domain-containing protein, partial [Ilumatobacteraceae bacterium]
MTAIETLPAIEHAPRPDAVKAVLDGATLLVSTPSNVRWLTGFGGSLGWAVIGPDRFTLVTDGRYEERAAADLASVGVDADIVTGRTRAEVRDRLVAAASGTTGPVRAEAGHLSHAAWLDLTNDLDLEPDGG